MGRKFSTDPSGRDSSLSLRMTGGRSLNTLKNEVEITFYKSSGPGGQRKNKRETAVRIHHLPSGITVIATEYRYQARNKELAWHRLQKRLEKLNIAKKPRIPTKKPRCACERILLGKKKLSEKKQLRTKVNEF